MLPFEMFFCVLKFIFQRHRKVLNIGGRAEASNLKYQSLLGTGQSVGSQGELHSNFYVKTLGHWLQISVAINTSNNNILYLDLKKNYNKHYYYYTGMLLGR